jgi:hypothetical protein
VLNNLIVQYPAMLPEWGALFENITKVEPLLHNA